MPILKLATEQDFESYFNLKSDSQNIFWSGHSNAPEKSKLKSWFLKNINSEERKFYLLFDNMKSNKAIGYLYIDLIKNVDEDVSSVEIAYGVHLEYNGMGYGNYLINNSIKLARNLKKVKVINAWIANDNFGSIKIVCKNGFIKMNDSMFKEFPNGDIKQFDKYQFSLFSNECS